MVTYLFLKFPGSSKFLRGKTKVYLGQKITSLEQLEWWTYDGSSTEQAVTNDSEIWIKPVFVCKDPFRKNGCLLALCEGYQSDKKTPAIGNFRQICEKVMNDAKHEDPWFGIE